MAAAASKTGYEFFFFIAAPVIAAVIDAASSTLESIYLFIIFSVCVFIDQCEIGVKMPLSEKKTSEKLFIGLYTKECYYFALDHHHHDPVKE